MIRYRTFRNPDMPGLADLWNRAAPGRSVARPLSVHELDAHIACHPLFDRRGLIVAERDGAIVGFAHAGFGPEDVNGPPWRFDHELGCVAMLIVAPSEDEGEVGRRLLDEAETYLKARGASVLYAGGQYPVNPYYWGIYGGSEFAGILGAEGGSTFARVALSAGYAPASTTILLERDLTQPEARNPRAVLLKRETRLEIEDDAPPADWWENLAVGEYRPAVARLLPRLDPGSLVLARATLWDMDWFGRLDGRSRLGLYGMEVHPEQRRRGYGRFLIAEIGRLARDQGIGLLCIQTAETNHVALSFYQSLGFEQVETAVLYRKLGVGAGGGRRGARRRIVTPGVAGRRLARQDGARSSHRIATDRDPPAPHGEGRTREKDHHGTSTTEPPRASGRRRGRGGARPELPPGTQATRRAG